MQAGWRSLESLHKMGIKVLGKNIKVSTKCSIYNPKNIILHDNIRIDDFAVLSASGQLVIKNYVHIAHQCLINAAKLIVFDNYTAISAGTKLYGATDDFSGIAITNPTVDICYRNVKSGDIILNPHTIIGTNTVILPGVHFGTGTAIGAQSLVLRDTEAWKIYAGSPIKLISERKKDVLEFDKKLEHTLL
jgi:galactoside O-acetyltransferase